MDMNSVSEDTESITREQVTLLASEAFRDHEITPVEGRPFMWRCGRPDKWVYAFFVSFVPGAVIITGDLGVTSFQCNYAPEEALRWLKGSGEYYSYILDKVHDRIAYRTFYPDAVVAAVKEYWPDCDDLLEEVQRAHRYGDLHPFRWYELIQDHSLDDAYRIGEGWSATAFWKFEAIRCFTRLHNTLVGAQQ